MVNITDPLIAVAITIWALMTLVYLLSLFLRNTSIVDLVWGLGFIAIATVLSYVASQDLTIQFQIVWILVIIWGARLSWHLARRFDPEREDWRYQQMRAKSPRSFWWLSYFKVFLLQGGLMMLVALPIILSVSGKTYNYGSVTAQTYLGIIIWLGGFLIEMIADRQLRNFRKSNHKPNDLLTSGLWRYSRHPNYFGEVTLWWGLFVVVVNWHNWWLALLSPLTITILILLVSGIPLLERRQKDNRFYQAYARRTSVFIPLPPKK